jgi:hypothetical protein
MTQFEKARFLRVLISEEYEGKDGKQKAWHEVGRAWFKTSRDGREMVSVRITPGLSVSGEFVIMAAEDRTEEPAPERKRSASDDGGDKASRHKGGR